jgi:RNA-directed DNA polymerase
VRRVQTAWKQRLRHAIDCDLKAFFDTVNHDRLLNQLRPKIGSGKLLRLIGRYLRAGVVLPDGTREATPLGVPQGGPLSPLLANIVLDPLDKELERRGMSMPATPTTSSSWWQGEKKAQRVMESVTLHRAQAQAHRQPHEEQKWATDREFVPRLLHQQSEDDQMDGKSAREV